MSNIPCVVAFVKRTLAGIDQLARKTQNTKYSGKYVIQGNEKCALIGTIPVTSSLSIKRAADAVQSRPIPEGIK